MSSSILTAESLMALLKAAAHHLDMVLNTYATGSWMIALSSLSHSVGSLLLSSHPLHPRRKSCYRTSVPTSFMTASDTLVPRRSKNAREDGSGENFPIEPDVETFRHSALYFRRYLPIIIHCETFICYERNSIPFELISTRSPLCTFPANSEFSW